MEIFKYIGILIGIPIVLIFCYFIGSSCIYTLFRNNDNVNSFNFDSWTFRIFSTILGLIIVIVISSLMEQAGCSSNDDYYRM